MVILLHFSLSNGGRIWHALEPALFSFLMLVGVELPFCIVLTIS